MKVYLASGWFNKLQDESLTFIEEVAFDNKNLKVFSPRKEIVLQKDATMEQQREVFYQNCKEIQESDFIIVNTEGKDPGTLFEAGFASANKKKIIYVWFTEDKNVKFNIMLSQSGIATFTDKVKFRDYIRTITSMEDLIEVEYKGFVE